MLCFRLSYADYTAYACGQFTGVVHHNIIKSTSLIVCPSNCCGLFGDEFCFIHKCHAYKKIYNPAQNHWSVQQWPREWHETTFQSFETNLSWCILMLNIVSFLRFGMRPYSLPNTLWLELVLDNMWMWSINLRSLIWYLALITRIQFMPRSLLYSCLKCLIHASWRPASCHALYVFHSSEPLNNRSCDYVASQFEEGISDVFFPETETDFLMHWKSVSHHPDRIFSVTHVASVSRVDTHICV